MVFDDKNVASGNGSESGGEQQPYSPQLSTNILSGVRYPSTHSFSI